jgi:hypothetical protein
MNDNMRKFSLKSQPNIGSFLTSLFIIGLIIYLVLSLIELEFIYNLLIISLIPLLMYYIIQLWINVFYFHDDYIEIRYIFRFNKRSVLIEYMDIDFIRYVHTAGPKQPMIVIVKKGDKFSKLFKPSNSFTYRDYNKRKQILEFLNSKGVKIQIHTDFKQDLQILLGKAIIVK